MTNGAWLDADIWFWWKSLKARRMREFARHYRGHDLLLVAKGKSDGAPEDQQAGGDLHFAFTVDDGVGVNWGRSRRECFGHDECAMVNLEAGRETLDHQARYE
jgi:hypothetical protein